MFEKATKNDYNEILEILIDAFKLSVSEASKMLDMTIDDTLLLRNGEIISVASALDFKFGNSTGKYIYAVATRKDFRNKGYCSLLLKELINYYNNKCDVLLLKPANKELFSFYKQNGFNDIIHANTLTFDIFSNSDIPLKKGTFNDYIKHRKHYTDFKWTEKVYNYNFDEYEYKVLYTENTLLLYRIEKDICYIDEIYTKDLNDTISAVHKITKANKIIVTVDGKDEFALAKFYKEKKDICFRLPME